MISTFSSYLTEKASTDDDEEIEQFNFKDTLDIFREYNSKKDKVVTLAIKFKHIVVKYTGSHIFRDIELVADKDKGQGIFCQRVRGSLNELDICGDLHPNVKMLVTNGEGNRVGFKALTKIVMQCVFPEVDIAYIEPYQDRVYTDEETGLSHMFWNVGDRKNHYCFEVEVDPDKGIIITYHPSMKGFRVDPEKEI